MRSRDLWRILGIKPTSDVREIRRAYARKLKVTHPEDDPEGFQRLRSAYEFALAHAEHPEAARLTTQIAQSADDVFVDELESAEPPPQLPAPAPDPETAALEDAFRKLHTALQAQDDIDEEQLKQQLQDVLGSPALGNLSMLHRVETDLIYLLNSTAPRSDRLLEPSIIRFNWKRYDGDHRIDPGITPLLKRWSDLHFMENLEQDPSDVAQGFRRLQRKSSPWVRRFRASFYSAEKLTEPVALAYIKDRHPALIAQLDPEEVAWWGDHPSRPRMSRPLSLIGRVVFAAGFFGILLSREAGDPFTDFAARLGMLAGGVLAVLLGKLFLLDVPLHWMAQRWRKGAPLPLPLQLGWLPASLVVLVAAAAVPAHPVAPWFFGVLGLACVVWATYMSGPMPATIQGGQIVLANSRLFRIVSLNGFLFIWWLGPRVLADTLESAQYAVAFATVMAASALGLAAAARCWLQQLVFQQRRIYVTALAACTLIFVVVAFVMPATEVWISVFTTGVIAVVILGRPAHASFTPLQRNVRWLSVAAGAFALKVAYDLGALHHELPAVHYGGLLFLTANVLNLGMAVYNERRGK